MKNLFLKWRLFCDISSFHGGEYDVQNCLLGCTTAYGSTSQKTILDIGRLCYLTNKKNLVIFNANRIVFVGT
jgi:protein involved in temperature-dependent protein secretion